MAMKLTVYIIYFRPDMLHSTDAQFLEKKDLRIAKAMVRSLYLVVLMGKMKI